MADVEALLPDKALVAVALVSGPAHRAGGVSRAGGRGVRARVWVFAAVLNTALESRADFVVAHGTNSHVLKMIGGQQKSASAGHH